MYSGYGCVISSDCHFAFEVVSVWCVVDDFCAVEWPESHVRGAESVNGPGESIDVFE